MTTASMPSGNGEAMNNAFATGGAGGQGGNGGAPGGAGGAGGTAGRASAGIGVEAANAPQAVAYAGATGGAGGSAGGLAANGADTVLLLGSGGPKRMGRGSRPARTSSFTQLWGMQIPLGMLVKYEYVPEFQSALYAPKPL